VDRTRWLALTALAYGVLHHLGAVPGGFGAVGVTRWGDWLDLAVPFLVLTPALFSVLGLGARAVAVFAVGAVMYVEGHGIHLAANSIGNVAPGPAAHLWDETVGHLLWYAGVAVITAVLGTAMSHLPWPATRVPRLTTVVLALLAGLTWATNCLGGDGTALPGLAVAVALTAYGLAHRNSLALALAAGYAPAALWLLGHAVVR
jgi:hypothetical protein